MFLLLHLIVFLCSFIAFYVFYSAGGHKHQAGVELLRHML